MFTGIEHFGIVFYLFWTSVVLWLRGSLKTTLDKVLLASALVGCAIVVSGVRKISWSNPRYIASILVIAAYFAAPLLVAMEDLLRRRAILPGKRIAVWALVVFLGFPTILVVSIRGAKVEITNPGTFYSDFRSLKWLNLTLEDPGGALRLLWQDYMGIRKTLRHLWADDKTKLRHAHDYFAGVLYISENAPADAKVLLFRTARFFYYCDRRGVVWNSPEVKLMRSRFNNAASAGDRLHILRGEGFTHVLVDSFSQTQSAYLHAGIGDVLADPELAEVEYEFGTARVYRLRHP